MNLHEYWRDLIQFYFKLFGIYMKFVRIYCESIWKYAHRRTAAHRCTARQPHTAALPHTAAHCRTLPHTAAHCRTLPGSRTLLQALPHTTSRTAAHGQVHCRTHPRALPQTSEHTAVHCRTAAHCRAHCHTLLRTPRTLHELKCHTPHTAHSRAPQLSWIKSIIFECVWINVDLCELMWIYMNSYKSKRSDLDVHELTSILTWFYLILCQIIWFIPNLSEFIWLYVLNLFENMHTARLPHTAAPLDSRTLPRTAALPDTAVRSAANCSTLHEFECQTAAHRTQHTAHRTQSHTANNMDLIQINLIKTNVCKGI
jgi:hypothetical protein